MIGGTPEHNSKYPVFIVDFGSVVQKVSLGSILYWSPIKQELEPFIAANKFGI